MDCFQNVIFFIRIIHEDGYNKDECLNYRRVIFSNTIQSMTAILNAMKMLRINFQNPDTCQLSNRYFAYVDNSSTLNPDLARIMKRIWLDPGVQSCFRRSREYQLNDSAY